MSVGGNAGYAELKLVFFRTLVLVYPCAGTTRTIGKPVVTENPRESWIGSCAFPSAAWYGKKGLRIMADRRRRLQYDDEG